MVDTHAHLPQLPNAGLGFALDLLTWLERVTFPTERSWADPAVAERLAPAIFEAFAAAGTTTVLGYGTVYAAAMDARLRGGRTARHPGDPRQGDDGSRDVRPDHRAVDDPRALTARIGRPDRALARRRRRPPRIRRHASVRRFVLGRDAARVGDTRPRDGHLVADARLGGSRRDRGGRAGSSPRHATTWMSTTVPAGSGSGPCWPTPSTCRIGSSRGCSRPGHGSPIARPRTCSSVPGVMPLARYLEAGLVGRARVGRLRRTRGFDLLGHACRRLRADGAALVRGRGGRGPRPARLAADGDAGGRAGTRPGRDHRLARGGQGGRPDRRRPVVRRRRSRAPRPTTTRATS